MATPHLGCTARRGPAQVPLVRWLNAVGLGFATSRLSEPFSARAFGESGRQFFFRDGDDSTPPIVYRLAFDQGAGGEEGAEKPAPKGGRGEAERGDPPGGAEGAGAVGSRAFFFGALASFETHTAYANRGGDHLVGWANASIRNLDQLPEINTRSEA